MTTKARPAAVARALTGAGTAIAMIGMITSFQVSTAAAEQQAQADMNAQAASPSSTAVRNQAVRVLDPSLLPEIIAAPVAAPAPSVRSGSTTTPLAAPAPPAPAPAAVQNAPRANGTTAGSGG